MPVLKSYHKHYVFIFYKDGTYKLHILSTSDDKRASANRRKILRFLPYDKNIKKFYVITGADNSSGFRMKIDRELNKKYDYNIHYDLEQHKLIQRKIRNNEI